MTPKFTGDGADKSAPSEAPKIEFPCENYPIKIVGKAAPDYQQVVLEIVEEHAPGFDRRSVSVRDSSGGRYSSVTVKITATGEAQLKAMFNDLKRHPLVQMVL